jgi:Holliday junction resolvasome RuvABC endonuclease subunit
MKIPETILGVDVGFRNTGVAVWRPDLQRFVHTEVIVTESTPKKERKVYVSDDLARCYRETCAGLIRVIRQYNVKDIWAELPTGAAQNSRAATTMGAAQAVIVVTAYMSGVRLFIVQPHQIKRLVSSSRKVPKDLVIAYVSKKYGRNILPDNRLAEHAADACMCIEIARQQ